MFRKIEHLSMTSSSNLKLTINLVMEFKRKPNKGRVSHFMRKANGRKIRNFQNGLKM